MRIIVIAASLSLFACTYPELEESNPDASTGCVAPATYGMPSMSSQTAKYYPPETDLPEAVTFLAKLNAASPADFVDIELIETPGGPFANGPTTATINLTGAESSTTTCAGCVLLIAKCMSCSVGQVYTGTVYIATSGTLKITQAARTGTLAGSLTNVTFRHVNINNTTGASTFHPDNCTTQIASAMFSAPIQQ